MKKWVQSYFRVCCKFYFYGVDKMYYISYVLKRTTRQTILMYNDLKFVSMNTASKKFKVNLISTIS